MAQNKTTGIKRTPWKTGCPELILWRYNGSQVDEVDLANSPRLNAIGLDRNSVFTVVNDFEGASGASLPYPWATQDTSAAGTPTLDFVDDAIGGEFQLLTDNTDEAQNITLYFGDQLVIDPTRDCIFQARIKIDADSLPLSADERFVCGVAAARNATLDSITHHAWFRVEGGSNNLLYESDDGTTDDDDNDTGVDIVDDTYLGLRIDMSNLSAVGFYVDSEAGAGFQLVGETDMSAITASNKLQVFVEFQKDGGTETEDLRIDLLQVATRRY